MKIEKISDKQIRCTLNHSDLHSRQISLPELAYGSEKARSLFHEMLQLANEEVGFITDNSPLMIEAVPLSSDGILLIITKVDDPDELDTRFSHFAPGMDMLPEENMDKIPEFAGSAGEVLESLKNMLQDALESSAESESIAVSEDIAPTDASDLKTSISSDDHEKSSEAASQTSRDIAAIIAFSTMDDVLRAARVMKGIYHGQNTLYKCRSERSYHLILHKSSHSPEEFNKICNIITEYGERRLSRTGTESYYREHMEVLLAEDALQQMGRMITK